MPLRFSPRPASKGAPIPRVPTGELAIADRLVKRGAKIRFYNDPRGRSERTYKYLHNKYGVVDGARVIVGSANYGLNGVVEKTVTYQPINTVEPMSRFSYGDRFDETRCVQSPHSVALGTNARVTYHDCK